MANQFKLQNIRTLAFCLRGPECTLFPPHKMLFARHRRKFANTFSNECHAMFCWYPARRSLPKNSVESARGLTHRAPRPRFGDGCVAR